MSHVRIWIHTVWVTKDRFPFLVPNLRYALITHLKQNAEKNGILLDHVNGWVDHLHGLVVLHPSQNLAEVVRLMKGESSHWINKGSWLEEPFSWQRGYFAKSVSPKDVPNVREYIRNQHIKHAEIDFEDEVSGFLDF